jgi:hypothetical protein
VSRAKGLVLHTGDPVGSAEKIRACKLRQYHRRTKDPAFRVQRREASWRNDKLRKLRPFVRRENTYFSCGRLVGLKIERNVIVAPGKFVPATVLWCGNC